MRDKSIEDKEGCKPAKHKVFFQLYGNCQNRLYGFLCMLVHNTSDAEDLLQETAATMWEQFDNFQQGTNFVAWGMTIAKRKAINFIKKNARTRPHLSHDLYQRIAGLEIHEKDDFSDRTDALIRCMKELKDIDRKLLLMRYERDFSMKNIAETLGRSTTGIYHTMARIHSVLYECIHNTLKAREIS